MNVQGGTLTFQSSGVASVATGAVTGTGGDIIFQSLAPTVYTISGDLGSGYFAGNGTMKVLGSSTLNVASQMVVAYGNAASNAALIIGKDDGTDAPTVNVGGWSAIGYEGNGTLTMNGGSKLQIAGDLLIGESNYGTPGTAIVTLNGNSSLTCNWMIVGYYGGTGTLIVNDNARRKQRRLLGGRTGMGHGFQY